MCQKSLHVLWVVRVKVLDVFVQSRVLGIGSRAGYYDKAGALRDMIQNHLTQLFTLIAMEVPSGFKGSAQGIALRYPLPLVSTR